MKKKNCGGYVVLSALFSVFLMAFSISEEKREQKQDMRQQQEPTEQKKSENDDVAATMEEILNKMLVAAANVKDYTCIFTKQEYVGNEMRRTETIFMKHKKEPHSVYMKWIKKPYKDRECLYCNGRYDNKLKAHEGHGIKSWFGTLSLNPKGGRAMKGNRHPITEAGIFNTIDKIKKDFELARQHPEHKVLYERLEEREVHGQPSICVFIIQPKNRKLGYYAHKAEICIHRELSLPTSVKIWDFIGRLVEFYTYREYKINVGLTDRDFDIKNREYDFSRN